MRCELMQMARMAVDDRVGAEAGEAMRRAEEIRRRRRKEREAEQEESENEYLGD